MRDEMDQMREKLAVQDSMNISKTEARAAAAKADEESTDLFNVEQVKAQLRKSLLGGQYRQVYVDSNGKITYDESQAVERKTMFFQTSTKQLINEEGFDAIWAEVQGFLNNNVQGSYLPSGIIEKECKGTLKTLRSQIMLNHEEFEVDNRQDASQIMSILRKNLVAAMHKSRGGRAMVNKERTLIEKITSANTDSDDEKSGIPGSGLVNL